MSGSIRGRPLSDRVPERAGAFARGLVRVGGDSVVAVILYGSQLHRSSPGMHSAWDLVVIADSYDGFHRAMRQAGHQRRSVALMNLLGGILPPYVTDFSPEEAEGGIAKCLVLTEGQFMEALGPQARDHFVKGRMVQHVEVVWSASAEHADRIERALAGARDDVLRWAGPFLDQPFDVRDLTRGMLEVSFAGELRPESGERVSEVWESQSGWLEETFAGVLRKAASRGRLVEAGGGRYRFAPGQRPAGRSALQRYFLQSKVRTTSRWLKHIMTFNDWLTYIQRKVERRTGLEIEITPAERRWPLILLWPKVFRVLREGRGQLPETETTE